MRFVRVFQVETCLDIDRSMLFFVRYRSSLSFSSVEGGILFLCFSVDVLTPS